MQKLILSAAAVLIAGMLNAQDFAASVAAKYKRLKAESQMKHALAAIIVTDAKTGQVLLEENSQLGLVPASTQKLIIAVSALESLGPDFQFQTSFYLQSADQTSPPGSEILVSGGYDPSLGSRRIRPSEPETLKAVLGNLLAQQGISNPQRVRVIQQEVGSGYRIPSSWIWEDMANYYGAAAAPLNWNENKYTLRLIPGARPGDSVRIKGAEPVLPYGFINELSSGPAGSGDESFLFFVPGRNEIRAQGSVPCCVPEFKVEGAVMDPVTYGGKEIARLLSVSGSADSEKASGRDLKSAQLLYTHNSPTLDSLVRPFLAKSINLYGECLVYAMAKQAGETSMDTGLQRIRQFWGKQGIDPGSLNLKDGSGLSPANRVTAAALVKALNYAYLRPWYPDFFAALPVVNGLHVKSGTIADVKAYAGYTKDRTGRWISFAVIVNNYSGSSAQMGARLRGLFSSE